MNVGREEFPVNVRRFLNVCRRSAWRRWKRKRTQRHSVRQRRSFAGGKPTVRNGERRWRRKLQAGGVHRATADASGGTEERSAVSTGVGCCASFGGGSCRRSAPRWKRRLLKCVQRNRKRPTSAKRSVMNWRGWKNGASVCRTNMIRSSQKLWEEYELTRREAEAVAKPVEQVTAAKRRLAELKSKIKALGSVNVAAVEEYRGGFGTVCFYDRPDCGCGAVAG